MGVYGKRWDRLHKLVRFCGVSINGCYKGGVLGSVACVRILCDVCDVCDGDVGKERKKRRRANKEHTVVGIHRTYSSGYQYTVDTINNE